MIFLSFFQHNSFVSFFKIKVNGLSIALRKCLLIFLVLAGITAKSQSLLNIDSAEITKQVLSKGGKLSRSTIESGLELPGSYHTIVYKFQESLNVPGDIYSMIFFLNLKNKCFKYLIGYTNDRYIDTLKKMFNSPDSGLKKVGGNLKWINPIKKYELTVLPRLSVNGAISHTFILEIKKD
jgi:hypothetical protein